MMASGIRSGIGQVIFAAKGQFDAAMGHPITKIPTGILSYPTAPVMMPSPAKRTLTDPPKPLAAVF